jgi:hypothetical protein
MGNRLILEVIDMLKAIVDCYGVGSTPEQFVGDVAGFIDEARGLLAKLGEGTKDGK